MLEVAILSCGYAYNVLNELSPKYVNWPGPCEALLDSIENKEVMFQNTVFGTKFANSKQSKLTGFHGLYLYVYELSKDSR